MSIQENLSEIKANIAAAVGYESLSHFVSVFKKEIGISPIKYKKNSTFPRKSHKRRIHNGKN